jgi:hypothetical protein
MSHGCCQTGLVAVSNGADVGDVFLAPEHQLVGEGGEAEAFDDVGAADEVVGMSTW